MSALKHPLLRLLLIVVASTTTLYTANAAVCGDANLPQFTTASNTVQPIDDCMDLMMMDGEVYGDCWYAPCIGLDFPTGSSYWEVVDLPNSVGTTAIEAKGATGIGMFMTETLDVSNLMMVSLNVVIDSLFTLPTPQTHESRDTVSV